MRLPALSTLLIRLLAGTLSFGWVSSFVVHRKRTHPIIIQPALQTCANTVKLHGRSAISTTRLAAIFTWSPQDLTKNAPGYPPIPEDDYVKKYQTNPKELWPVEFFVIAYRRRVVGEKEKDDEEGGKSNKQRTDNSTTQILVRRSANGTSKYGLGTGVPATRWLLSSANRPPVGYRWSIPKISFEACNFPEFPTEQDEYWDYNKIDIEEDAFAKEEFNDPELEAYAKKIRNELRDTLSERMRNVDNVESWEYIRGAVVKNVLDNPNSLAAIQGTLRMSGLFARREEGDNNNNDNNARYLSLDKDTPDPTKLVESMRIYTMFPQMPDPMPLPSTTPQELQEEIGTRQSRMVQSGRDPHKDRYGRKFTHISTSNVSNTIHGVYFTLDLTGLPGLDDVPAYDLFGKKKIQREWVSLQDLKVLDSKGDSISTEDTKPTFISGFIVRQLLKEGVIETHQ